MTLDDTADKRKTDAGAREVLDPMQPLERAEEFVRVARIKARAIVSNKIDMFAVLGKTTDLDQGIFLFPREFERIANKVNEYLLQEERVANALRELADPHFQAS